MYATLREFVEALEGEGSLRRVRVPVSPVLEIAAIADRVSKMAAPVGPSEGVRRTDGRFWHLGGPALLFERVEGSSVPVLINAYGSYGRVERALGCAVEGLEGLAARIGALVEMKMPRGFGEAWEMARRLWPALRIGPRVVRRARCQEEVWEGEAVDLRRLPLIRAWPLDGDPESVGYPGGLNAGIEGAGGGEEWERVYRGRYITLAGVHTIDASEAGERRPRSHNVGMYRMQLIGPRLLGMHWHVHHDGAGHWRSWKRAGRAMPVAIALGGSAEMAYAATAPLPPGMSELLLAGLLRGRGVPLVRCRTVPLRVPADSEMVIEGWVETSCEGPGWEVGEPLGEGAVLEGPFGDHTGFYSMPDRYPLMRVTAVTAARGAVYPTTVVGPPPQEDYFLGKATERLFLPLLRVLIPDVEDYDLPMFGAFHNCVFVGIRKRYAMQARRVMHAVWGAGQMAWTKTVFVVDEDVDVHDARAVLRACAQRCDPEHDVEQVRGPLDVLDHAAPALGAGGKMGFDCTRRWPGERFGEGRRRVRFGAERALLGVEGVCGVSMPEELGGWLFVSTRRCEASEVDALGREAVERTGAPYVGVVGEGVDVSDVDAVMFWLLANADMGRDSAIRRGSDGSAGRVIDGTPKRPGERRGQPVRAWPPAQRFDDATLELVERRWGEYGIG